MNDLKQNSHNSDLNELEEDLKIIQELFERSHDGILVLSPNLHTILYINKQLETILGYRSEDLLQKPFDVILPPEGFLFKIFEYYQSEQKNNPVYWQLKKANGELEKIEFVQTTYRCRFSDKNLTLIHIVDSDERLNLELRMNYSKNILYAIRGIKESLSDLVNPKEVIGISLNYIKKARNFDLVWGVIFDEYSTPDYLFAEDQIKADFKIHAKHFMESEEENLPIKVLIQNSSLPFYYSNSVREDFPEWWKAISYYDQVISLSIPIVWENRLFGALEFISFHEKAFSEEDFILLSELGRDIGFAFYNLDFEIQLRESEQKLRNLFSSMDDGILIVNNDAKIIEIAPESKFLLLQFHNLKVGEYAFHFLNPITRAQVMVKLRTSILYERTESFEFKMHFMGEEKFYLIRFFPIKKHKKEEKAVLLSFSDVTESRSLQAQLLETARYASIGELAAGIAHEINNPLQSALLYLEDLIAVDENDPVERKVILKKIEAANVRIRNLIRSLLDFGRSESSVKELVRPQMIVNRAVELTEIQTKKKNIEIKKIFSGDTPQIFVHWQEIEQVLINCIVNAINAINEAETTPAKPVISVLLSKETTKEGDWVVFVISDNGPGMPQDVLNKVFLPLFTTRRTKQGTGLGLSISKRIVNNHGGEIKLFSSVGHGTMVSIRIPVQKV